jgi:hypothetical protein
MDAYVECVDWSNNNNITIIIIINIIAKECILFMVYSAALSVIHTVPHWIIGCVINDVLQRMRKVYFKVLSWHLPGESTETSAMIISVLASDMSTYQGVNSKGVNVVSFH